MGELTQPLIAVKEGAAEEHARFLAIGERGLCLPEAQLSALAVRGHGAGHRRDRLYRLHADGPGGGARAGRLVSVSRGITDGWPTQAAAEYRQADVRDRARWRR